MRAWRAEFEAFRPLLLGVGLKEEFKWYIPCYTHGGSNVVIFQPFKELCALLFFKGVLLQDPGGALKAQGENTRSALRLEFRSVTDADSVLHDAWQRLTPGRRPGWLLHFNGARQSKTRVARIERATPRILEGFGRVGERRPDRTA